MWLCPEFPLSQIAPPSLIPPKSLSWFIFSIETRICVSVCHTVNVWLTHCIDWMCRGKRSHLLTYMYPILPELKKNASFSLKWLNKTTFSFWAAFCKLDWFIWCSMDHIQEFVFRIKLMRRNRHAKVTYTLEIFAFDFQLRVHDDFKGFIVINHIRCFIFHHRHWGTQIQKLWKQTAWVKQCLIPHGGTITPSPSPQNNLFLPSDCIFKFGPLHLLLCITSKRIKLQMWDCAQTKALEKSFNLVTDKSCLKRTKGAKMSHRKIAFFLLRVVYCTNFPVHVSLVLWLFNRFFLAPEPSQHSPTSSQYTTVPKLVTPNGCVPEKATSVRHSKVTGGIC